MKLSNKIFTCFRLPVTITTILKNLSTQRSFLQKNIQPILAEAQQHNDGSLDSSDLKKINHYYGLAVPAILGEAFCALHNKKMSNKERMASTSQGSMTGLFDDFFDKQYLSDDTIENILHKENTVFEKRNEKLFNEFYRKALQNVPDKKRMQEALTEVYKAQLESKKQTQQNIQAEEIEAVTFYKGGASLLFYRTAFLPVPSAEEEKLIYNLGSLMQLANDIFDVYKDRENGIRTLVTEAKNIEPVRRLLKEKLAICYTSAFGLGLNKKNVQRYLAILSLGIFSRTFVCLDQLEKNESTTNGIYLVQQYSRKQLICDMDKLRNMLRSAAYHIKLCR